MICENCNSEHLGEYGSGRFCSIKCARGFSTKNKRKEINEKVSSIMSGRKLDPEHIKNIERATNFNRKEKVVKSCLMCGSSLTCLVESNRKFCTSKCWVNYSEQHKEPFLLYRQQCNFTFSVTEYQHKFDWFLVEQHGWYSPSNKGNNLNGVSKDHMLSVREGFELGIDPEIIKHPANCQFLLHKQNQSKREKSSITIEELLVRIKNW
jgi:hypothetical protein